MLQFSGHERFAASPERLFALLTDFDALATTIPDLVSSEKVDERTLKCVIRPGFSFVRGTLRTTITLDQATPPTSATVSVAAQGIGASMSGVSTMTISPDGPGSSLEWNAEVRELKGLLSAVSQGLIKAAADQVIRHAWTKIRHQLGE